jgi:plastocyanin
MTTRRTITGLAVALLVGDAGIVAAQGTTDRPANLSGEWVGVPGTVYFNFVHRFTASDAPERKVSNSPTFVIATPIESHSLVGVAYATNSTLASRYPNEHEYFVRVRPWLRRNGAPADLGIHLDYNDAARGVDAELGFTRDVGRLRLLSVSRLLKRPDSSGFRAAFGGGALYHLGRYVALSGDAVAMRHRSPEERVAWSGALQVQIPLTPHTVSLHVTNVDVGTLQSSSRGTRQRRYGFEFTIPLTLRRYFGRRAAAPRDSTTARPATGPVVQVSIRGLAFHVPADSIALGTTVEWKNDDPLAHTVTAAAGGFQSPLIEPGQTWRYTFTAPGTYAFYCTPHPFMRGVVVVR